jgi:hypothetical protein
VRVVVTYTKSITDPPGSAATSERGAHWAGAILIEGRVC